MSTLQQLAGCAGAWQGTNRLQDPHIGQPDESPSTATVSPVLRGKFIRLDYTWVYRGETQEGSLLIGRVAQTGEVTAHWIDTWHMGDKVMSCQGIADGAGAISVRGSYAAPPGPDWGWRMVITPKAGQSLELVMYNITPDGQEELAVEASYAWLNAVPTGRSE